MDLSFTEYPTLGFKPQKLMILDPLLDYELPRPPFSREAFARRLAASRNPPPGFPPNEIPVVSPPQPVASTSSTPQCLPLKKRKTLVFTPSQQVEVVLKEQHSLPPVVPVAPRIPYVVQPKRLQPDRAAKKHKTFRRDSCILEGCKIKKVLTNDNLRRTRNAIFARFYPDQIVDRTIFDQVQFPIKTLGWVRLETPPQFPQSKITKRKLIASSARLLFKQNKDTISILGKQRRIIVNGEDLGPAGPRRNVPCEPLSTERPRPVTYPDWLVENGLLEAFAHKFARAPVPINKRAHYYAAVLGLTNNLGHKLKLRMILYREYGWVDFAQLPLTPMEIIKGGASTTDPPKNIPGYYPMPSDGNCIWHALSSVLFDNAKGSITVATLKDSFKRSFHKHLNVGVPLFYEDVDSLTKQCNLQADTEFPEEPQFADAFVIYVIAKTYDISIVVRNEHASYICGDAELPKVTTSIIHIIDKHAYVPEKPGTTYLGIKLSTYVDTLVNDTIVENIRPQKLMSDSFAESDDVVISNDSIFSAVSGIFAAEAGPGSDLPGKDDAIKTLVNKMTEAFSTSSVRSKGLVAAKVTFPMLAASTNIYNLARLVGTGVSKWYDVMINLISTVACFLNLYQAIWEVKDASRLSNLLMTAATNMFGVESHASPKPFYVTAIKGMALLMGGALIASGKFSSFAKFTGLVSAAAMVGDLSKDLVHVLAKMFGFDADCTKDTNDSVLTRIQTANAHLSKPLPSWVGDQMKDIQSFADESKKFIQEAKPYADPVTLQTLMNAVVKIDEHMRNIREDWASRESRPAPVGVYLWSTQGGLGKTAFARHLPKLLKARIEGFNDKVFSVQFHSAHFANYFGEHTLWVDEVGGAKGTSPDKNPFIHVNDIISSNPTPMPSANLAGKNQIPRPFVVLMTSNYSMDTLDTKLKNESKDAMMSRFLMAEFTDPKFDPARANAREYQSHRKPDFSHITIRVKTEKGVQDLTPDAFADEIALRIAQSLENHGVLNTAPLPVARPMKFKGKQISIKPFISHGAEDTKFVHYVVGKPGVGKSRLMVPKFEEMARMCHLPIYKPTTKTELRAIIDSSKRLPPGALYIIDDVIDMRSDQDLFMEFYNALPRVSKVLVLSNFGPRDRTNHGAFSHFCPTAIASPFQGIELKAPGLGRRLGFDGASETARIIVRTQMGMYDYNTGKQLSDDILLQDWIKFITDDFYPTRLPQMPDDLPFTSQDADIWYETDQTDPVSIKTAIVANASWRLRQYMIGNPAISFDHDDVATSMQVLCFDMLKKVIDPKVYVNIAGRVHYFNGKEYFVGSEPVPATYTPEPPTLNGRLQWRLTNEIVQAVHAGAPERIDPELYICLGKHRDRDTTIWRKIAARFPPNTQSLLSKISVFMKTCFSKFWAVIKSEPLITALILAVLAGMQAFLWWRQSSDKPDNTPNFDPKKHTPPCGRCFGTAYLDSCLGVSHKGKGGKSKPTMKVIKLNGNNSRSIASEQDNDFEERLAHDANYYLSTEGFHKPTNKIRKEIMGSEYDLSYQWVNGRIEMSADLAPVSHSGKGVDSVRNNVMSLVIKETSYFSQCFAINPHLIRIPLHMLNFGPVFAIKDGIEYSLDVIYRFQDRDVAYAVPKRKGKACTIPGVSSLEKHLLSSTEVSTIKHVVAHDHITGEKSHLPFSFQPVMASPFCSADATISCQAGLCFQGEVPAPFLKRGACGAPITWDKNNKTFIVGNYAGSDAAGGFWIFPVITIEEYNIVSASLKQSHSSFKDVIPANWMVKDDTRLAREIYTVPAVVDACGQAALAPNQLSGGLTTVASYRNKISIDQTTKKTLIFGGVFQKLFNAKKFPVLTKAEIEDRFPHKIPGDIFGNLHAENIRLSSALPNISMVHHPSFIYKAKFLELAAELGRYWKHQLLEPVVTPLSVDDAIWGNGCGVESLKLSSSVGAAFTSIFPTTYLKSNIFGTRGEWKGHVGESVRDLVDTQWNMWKESKELMLPSTFSLKTELLATEKIWKKRVINVCDPVTVVNLRRLFYPMQQEFSRLGAKSPFSIAIDPMVAFDNLARKLSSYKSIYDADFSSFDLSLPAIILEAAGEFCVHAFGAGHVLSTMIRTSIKTIFSMPVLGGTSLFTRDAGMPSGIPCTSFLDSVSGMLIYYIAFCMMNPGISPEEYYAANWTYHCGDDVVLGTSDPDFTGTQVQSFCKDVLQMKITDPSKGANDTVVAKQLHEVSFLSRTFIRIPGHLQYWIGMLKEESIMGALTFSKSMDPSEQLALLSSKIPEVCLHPPHLYQDFCATVKENRIDIPLPRREKVLEELAHKIQSARANDLMYMYQENLTSKVIPFTQLSFPALKPIEFADIQTIPNEADLVDMPKQSVSSRLRTMRKQIVDDNFDICYLIDVLQELWSQLPANPIYQVTHEGQTFNLPSQIGGPVFWKHVFGYFVHHQKEPWIQQLRGQHDNFPRGKRWNNVRDLTKVADAIAECNNECGSQNVAPLAPWLEGTHSHAGGSSGGSEAPVVSNTAQPANVDAAPSASTGAANSVPVGVADDPLASEAIADVVQLHPTSGATKPAVMLQPVGGVGMEITPQTGVGFNLLSLAGKKIFRKIHTINTGVAQGTKVFEYDINPWNTELLNPHAQAWANLHSRFFGAMELHLQVVTSATIIGNLKAAFIPAIYADKIDYSQSNLDAFNPVEFACNVNGEATINCIPMAKEYALTGIYRDSNTLSFGKIICIAATNIENAYTTEVGVQIKVALSLQEGSIYDLPTTLDRGGDSDITNDNINIGAHSAGPRLITDGLHEEPALYDMDPVLESDVIPWGFIPGTRYLVGTIGINGEKQELSTKPAKYTLNAGSGCYELTNLVADPNLIYLDNVNKGTIHIEILDDSEVNLYTTNDGRTRQKKFGTYEALKTQVTGSWLYDGHQVVYSAATSKEHPFSINTHKGSSSTMGTLHSAVYGDTLCKRPDGSYYINHETSLEVLCTHTNQALPPPRVLGTGLYSKGVYPIYELGIEPPISKQDAKIGNFCPANLVNVKLIDNTCFVPSVNPTATSHTILTCDAHVDTVTKGYMYAVQNGGRSLITTLVDDAGNIAMQVVRNSVGMFANRASIPIYGRLVAQVDRLKQVHTISSVKFPNLQRSAGTFKDRVIGIFNIGLVGGHEASGFITPQQMGESHAGLDLDLFGGPAMGGSTSSPPLQPLSSRGNPSRYYSRNNVKFRGEVRRTLASLVRTEQLQERNERYIESVTPAKSESHAAAIGLGVGSLLAGLFGSAISGGVSASNNAKNNENARKMQGAQIHYDQMKYKFDAKVAGTMQSKNLNLQSAMQDATIKQETAMQKNSFAQQRKLQSNDFGQALRIQDKNFNQASKMQHSGYSYEADMQNARFTQQSRVQSADFKQQNSLRKMDFGQAQKLQQQQFSQARYLQAQDLAQKRLFINQALLQGNTVTAGTF